LEIALPYLVQAAFAALCDFWTYRLARRLFGNNVAKWTVNCAGYEILIEAVLFGDFVVELVCSYEDVFEFSRDDAYGGGVALLALAISFSPPGNKLQQVPNPNFANLTIAAIFPFRLSWHR
jgi:hypothetical protein